MPEREGLNSMGTAFQQMVKGIKREQDPNYPGDNPENADQTMADLRKLGVVKESRTENGEKRKEKKQRIKKDHKSKKNQEPEAPEIVAGINSETGEPLKVRPKILTRKGMAEHLTAAVGEVREDLNKTPAELGDKYSENRVEPEAEMVGNEPNGNEITSLWNTVNSRTSKISEGDRQLAANRLAGLYQNRLKDGELPGPERERIQAQLDRVLLWKKQRVPVNVKHIESQKKEQYDKALEADKKNRREAASVKHQQWLRDNPVEAQPAVTELQERVERVTDAFIASQNRQEMTLSGAPQDLGGKQSEQPAERFKIRGGDIVTQAELDALSGNPPALEKPVPNPQPETGKRKILTEEAFEEILASAHKPGTAAEARVSPEKTEDEKLKEMIGADWEQGARAIFKENGYNEEAIRTMIQTMKPVEVESIFKQIKG
jgi:hypothetical protein